MSVIYKHVSCVSKCLFNLFTIIHSLVLEIFLRAELCNELSQRQSCSEKPSQKMIKLFEYEYLNYTTTQAFLHAEIFLATCNAIPILCKQYHSKIQSLPDRLTFLLSCCLQNFPLNTRKNAYNFNIHLIRICCDQPDNQNCFEKAKHSQITW